MPSRLRDKITAVAVVLVALFAVAIALSTHRTAGYQVTSVPMPFAVNHHMVTETAMRSSADSAALTNAIAQASGNSGQAPLTPAALELARPNAQLVRTATISLRVSDVAQSLHAVSHITTTQMGDVISLNDETPDSSSDPHIATITIRIPVTRFDDTLEQLRKLGKLESQSVAASDVSDQIIDGTARLRNLRRTEQDILNIMDRLGNIEQVLDVTQQLGAVRDQIERLSAQLQNVKNQVAYSTIDITLHQPAAVVAPSQLQILKDAWKAAAAAVRDFTLSLLGVGIWLVAFSPYLVLMALAGLLGYRRLRRS
jgi:Domain of unknown function (DUF4349)